MARVVPEDPHCGLADGGLLASRFPDLDICERDEPTPAALAEMAGRADYLRFKIGELNLQLGKMDQARLEFRDLLIKRPNSKFAPKTYYLVGYSYYLEKRFNLALAVFRGTARKFPGTPIAIRSEFFVADTLEDQGKMKLALKSFLALKNRYPFPDIIQRRIRTLRARIRRGVR